MNEQILLLKQSLLEWKLKNHELITKMQEMHDIEYVKYGNTCLVFLVITLTLFAIIYYKMSESSEKEANKKFALLFSTGLFSFLLFVGVVINFSKDFNLFNILNV